MFFYDTIDCTRWEKLRGPVTLQRHNQMTHSFKHWPAEQAKEKWILVMPENIQRFAHWPTKIIHRMIIHSLQNLSHDWNESLIQTLAY